MEEFFEPECTLESQLTVRLRLTGTFFSASRYLDTGLLFQKRHSGHRSNMPLGSGKITLKKITIRKLSTGKNDIFYIIINEMCFGFKVTFAQYAYMASHLSHIIYYNCIFFL